MFSTYFSVIAAFVALVSLIYSAFALRKARRAIEWCNSAVRYLQHENTNDKTLREMAELQAELTSQADSIAALGKTLKSLRSRVGMRELRAKREESGSDIPDPKSDPDAWKRYMRKELHLNGGKNSAD